MEAADSTLEDVKKLRGRPPHPVGVVWPDGRVTAHRIGDPNVKLGHPHHPNRWVNANGGLVVVKFIEGQPIITQAGRKLGCRLLEDVCREEKQMDKFEAWNKAMKARDMGRHIVAPTSAIYPDSVLAARERQKRIGDAGGMDVFEADADSPERVARLLANVGIEVDPEDVETAKESESEMVKKAKIEKKARGGEETEKETGKKKRK